MAFAGSRAWVRSSPNGFPLTTHSGSIGCQEQMEHNTHAPYPDFDQRRKQQEAMQADQRDEAELKALESSVEASGQTMD